MVVFVSYFGNKAEVHLGTCEVEYKQCISSKKGPICLVQKMHSELCCIDPFMVFHQGVAKDADELQSPTVGNNGAEVDPTLLYKVDPTLLSTFVNCD